MCGQLALQEHARPWWMGRVLAKTSTGTCGKFLFRLEIRLGKESLPSNKGSQLLPLLLFWALAKGEGRVWGREGVRAFWKRSLQLSSTLGWSSLNTANLTQVYSTSCLWVSKHINDNPGTWTYPFLWLLFILLLEGSYFTLSAREQEHPTWYWS